MAEVAESFTCAKPKQVMLKGQLACERRFMQSKQSKQPNSFDVLLDAVSRSNVQPLPVDYFVNKIEGK